MADEDKVYIALAIRDTNSHDSTVCMSGETDPSNILIENGLDQTVTFQLQGGRCEGDTYINIGDTFDVSASTNTCQSISIYFSKYRLQASCSVSPTTGELDAWILKKGR